MTVGKYWRRKTPTIVGPERPASQGWREDGQRGGAAGRSRRIALRADRYPRRRAKMDQGAIAQLLRIALAFFRKLDDSLGDDRADGMISSVRKSKRDASHLEC